MNNNQKICSGSSPFRYFPDEELEEVKNGVPGQIRFSELDKLVLGTLNRVLVATSLLLHRYLEEAGLKNTTVDDVRGCLRRLADNGYLTRLRFRTPEGFSNLQIYKLTKQGRDEIRKGGQSALCMGYLFGMDSIHAKRQLAALQFIINHGYVKYAARTEHGTVVMDLCDTLRVRRFRTQAVIPGREKTVLVEAVRDYPGATEELVRKLKRIQTTLNGERVNLCGSRNYEVVIVAESHSHMKRLMKKLNAELPDDLCSMVVFTNDLDTFLGNRQLYPLPQKQAHKYSLPHKLARLFGLV